ncbi:unnamed protein product, partial [Prorocentrum cordatum]
PRRRLAVRRRWRRARGRGPPPGRHALQVLLGPGARGRGDGRADPGAGRVAASIPLGGVGQRAPRGRARRPLPRQPRRRSLRGPGWAARAERDPGE